MITNPILRGFQPDASVCVVGEDYYIATSTFEWWPGIMIYHSKDLIRWELVARPLCRKEQLSLRGDRNSGGIWAPHLSWARGKFWLLITDVKTDQCFKDTLNYIMSCETIDGEWSNPVFVHASGFDPALFHDSDGKSYVMSMLWDYRPYKPNFNGVAIQEYDLEALKLVGKPKTIFHGSGWGTTEGPQILKKDGFYYLLCAKGGTGFSHASVVARATSLWGPYELSPYTPLISTRFAPDSPLQKCGHASFLRTSAGEWYITFICARPLTLQRGNCILGRETGLAKIIWEQGWPRLAQAQTAPYSKREGGEIHLPDRTVILPKPPTSAGWNCQTVPPLTLEAPLGAELLVQNTDASTQTDFDEAELPPYFHSLRIPLEDKLSLKERPSFLRLYGQESIASLHRQTLVARRWQSVRFQAGTIMEFTPKSHQQMAGLTCFYNTENYMYAYVSYDEELGCRILDVLVCTKGKTMVKLGERRIQIPEDSTRIRLEVRVDREKLNFFYAFDAEAFLPLADTLSAESLSEDFIRDSALVFTGPMVGMCVQDLYDHSCYADFDSFYYQEYEKANYEGRENDGKHTSRSCG
ncbi:MAG: glycoside hydrolase family 43 protein [bacterium]|nr:glycoside hydrolase family 43 protein [bacterium]